MGWSADVAEAALNASSASFTTAADCRALLGIHPYAWSETKTKWAKTVLSSACGENGAYPE